MVRVSRIFWVSSILALIIATLGVCGVYGKGSSLNTNMFTIWSFLTGMALGALVIIRR